MTNKTIINKLKKIVKNIREPNIFFALTQTEIAIKKLIERLEKNKTK